MYYATLALLMLETTVSEPITQLFITLPVIDIDVFRFVNRVFWNHIQADLFRELSKILFPNILGLFTFLLADFFFKCDRGLCTSVEFLLFLVKTIVPCVHIDSLNGNAEIH